MGIIKFLCFMWFGIFGIIAIPLIFIDKVFSSFIKCVIYLGILPSLVIIHDEKLEELHNKLKEN